MTESTMGTNWGHGKGVFVNRCHLTELFQRETIRTLSSTIAPAPKYLCIPYCYLRLTPFLPLEGDFLVFLVIPPAISS
jgi:hypothetical protein